MPKVAIVRCADYDGVRVSAAVEREVGLAGGIGRFVSPGMKVLVKPNLLSERAPEEAVDTHPEVVRAVVRLVKGSGASAVIGDSPGGYGKNAEEIFEKSGMRRVAAEEGAGLVKFSHPRFVDGIPVAREVFECDRIISVPKLKTHSVTVITGAVKNMYGAVTGLYKAEAHSRAPREEDFVKVLIRVYSAARPHLTLLDGIVGMEGDGPAAGKPRAVNLVMAGEDAVAIDSCIARIIGLKPLDILVTKAAYEAGLGEADPGRIEVLGETLESLTVRDFKLPQTMPLRIIPRSVVKALAPLIRFRPYIDVSICTRCGLCKSSCAVDAITIEKDRCGIDYRRCVRCMCCHELCPHKAISIRRNFLTRMVWG